MIRFCNEDILNALFNVERTLENFVDEFEKKNGKKKARERRDAPLNPLKGRFEERM